MVKRKLAPEMRLACFTLDLEDDWYFNEPGFDHLTFEYIDEFIELVSSLDIPVTVFAVGKTLEKFPEDVALLQDKLDSEFHLHSYSHDITKSYDFEEEVAKGIDAFESFFKKKPRGYRAPQGNIEPGEIRHLDSVGFEFDSSIFPSFRPGIYSNLDKPLHPYSPPGTEQIVEYPIGAIPGVRLPISQSYVKLLGRPYLRSFKYVPLPNVVVIDSHLQDFYRTASHDNLSTPLRQIHKRNLGNSIKLFKTLVRYLRTRGYKFVTLTEIHDGKVAL
ncbi:polysaccharide deacetylase family protein [Natronosalvus rutilus]|uniref:Polysaccharide deacetylase family protein n=1 Tax=Natronosalvus rutilus TaxID=2953753 RepID=A0A9E7ND50_9EURY|nr:polysaccharide deacetylase family protein [Natronosalvus rutilus]UTF54803.1 polysaccharide deacetylase family protein [Natronosalvus rutilus]